MLKESNKSRFDSFSRQEPCTDHIPFYFSGLSRAFSDNLSRNSCIARTPDVSSKINNMYQVIVPPIMISYGYLLQKGRFCQPNKASEFSAREPFSNMTFATKRSNVR